MPVSAIPIGPDAKPAIYREYDILSGRRAADVRPCGVPAPKSLEFAEPKPLIEADAKARGAVDDDRCSWGTPDAADRRTRQGTPQGLPTLRSHLLVGGVGVRLLLRTAHLLAGPAGGARR